ncbi:hypothetical protein SUGI_0289290 [Cryptomeria japonica]|nr:hypothetical protein SUGI_0289290 [Cryptomeria japonica]
MAVYQDFYVSNDGYAMQDGTPWIGNNPQDHPEMIQVFLGHIRALDIVGNELPRLVYVSREKRLGFQHHKRAGAMNALGFNSGWHRPHSYSLYFHPSCQGHCRTGFPSRV